MPDPGADTYIRLDKHSDHPSAVTATIIGKSIHTTRALLSLHGFEPVGETTMLMVRIDHEEPHYAYEAAHALRAQGITVDLSPELLDDINTDWTWANYPMHWLNRDEIREVSNEAQKIHDDIRHDRLTIHLHAHDGWTTVAVGTYRDGQSIHLHGGDHLRVVSTTYKDPAEAIAEFERLYGDAVRPGPAPATDTEQQAETTRAPAIAATPGPSTKETVPVHAAEAGDHEALLDDFLESHGEWEKYRTWSDETTHAVHESLTLRAEFVHEADPDDTRWTIAAYESPVGDRLWHATATATTPVEIMRVLLDALATGDAAQTAVGSQVSEKTISEATQPLADAGWEHTLNGRWIRWHVPGEHAAGVQFDAFAAQQPTGPLPAWTVWGGATVHQPTWALHFSAHASAAVLQSLAFELANGLAQKPSATPPAPSRLTTRAQAPAPPATPATAPGRNR